MKIKELFKNTPYFVLQGSDDIEITGICDNSVKCKPGELFISIIGEKVDGHDK